MVSIMNARCREDSLHRASMIIYLNSAYNKPILLFRILYGVRHHWQCLYFRYLCRFLIRQYIVPMLSPVGVCVRLILGYLLFNFDASFLSFFNLSI